MNAMWVAAAGCAVAGLVAGSALARKDRLEQKTKGRTHGSLESGVRSDAPYIAHLHDAAFIFLGIVLLAAWVITLVERWILELVLSALIGAGAGVVAANWWYDWHPPRE